jgi:peptidyl-prolyl cis-trans isomerase C
VSANLAAELGGREVAYARFEAFVRQQVGEGGGGLDSEVLSQLFDQFLAEEMLALLAVDEQRVPAGSSPRQAVDALLADAGEPSAAEVEQWYRAHRAELVVPERVVLRQILVADEALAEVARRRIERGEAFAEVARELSRDPSAEVGGLQGEIALEDLPATFAQQVAGLAAGQVGEPIEATDGWHLFQVEERLPARPRPLAEVAPEIVARLRRERSDAVLERRLAEAADRYNVTVHAQNLPFEYSGQYAPEGAPPRRQEPSTNP